LLNFSDEIYSNIKNNYNYYLFVIYKSCFDLLSLLVLYIRMDYNVLFNPSLQYSQNGDSTTNAGGLLSLQTLNVTPNQIELEDNHTFWLRTHCIFSRRY
jgi:hypothetical protein